MVHLKFVVGHVLFHRHRPTDTLMVCKTIAVDCSKQKSLELTLFKLSYKVFFLRKGLTTYEASASLTLNVKAT